MDLTTRCPECDTTFAASLEQLQLRKGYIRCINCAHIFDGFEAVVSPGSVAPDHHISSASPGKGPAFTIPANVTHNASGTRADPVFHAGSASEPGRPEPSISVHAEAADSADTVVHHTGQA